MGGVKFYRSIAGIYLCIRVSYWGIWKSESFFFRSSSVSWVVRVSSVNCGLEREVGLVLF